MLKSSSVQISPSVMCADFLHLDDEINIFEKHNIPLIHIDIMDGHYVPNFTLGPDFCKKIADRTSIPLDIHLMIEDVDKYIPVFAKFNSPYICFHPEVSYHPMRSISLIRSLGAHPGIAIDPSMSIDQFKYLLPEVDMVCIMTVNPGYSGQQLIPGMLDKIRELKAYLKAEGLNVLIEVDGNVSWENIPGMIEVGADILVAGTSSVFSLTLSREEALQKMDTLIKKNNGKSVYCLD